MQAIAGFSPDSDPTLPGVLTDCTNFIPYETGMQGAPTAVTVSSVPALAAACIGSVVAVKLDATRRTFAGTATKLYELSGGAWTDVSAAGNYTGGADARWSFTQFGDATIASNGVEAIQRSNGSGAFAAIATAPKAKIVFSVGSFVMALNTNDGASKPDGWHCSGVFDDTTWTPAVATQANSGRLVSVGGPITAGAKLGEYAIAYKERAIYLGQYVGSPIVWDWVQMPGGEAGCIGQEALCDIGGAHFIVGNDNFWIFSGTTPTPIGTGQVRNWFFANSSDVYRYKTICSFDKQTNRVFIYYVSKNGSSLDSVMVYHLLTKQWGRMTISIEAALTYTTAGITIDGLSAVSATIDGLSALSFDSPYWNAGNKVTAIYNTSHQLQSLTGVSATSDFTTGDAGDDDDVTLLRRLRLRYAPGYNPTTSTATAYGKMNEGDAVTLVTSSGASDGKFDFLQSSRWHRAKVAFTGDVRVMALRPDFAKAGKF